LFNQNYYLYFYLPFTNSFYVEFYKAPWQRLPPHLVCSGLAMPSPRSGLHFLMGVAARQKKRPAWTRPAVAKRDSNNIKTRIKT